MADILSIGTLFQDLGMNFMCENTVVIILLDDGSQKCPLQVSYRHKMRKTKNSLGSGSYD